MSLGSVTLSTTTAAGSAADRASDAALAKAVAKLAADKKAGAAAKVLSSDQQLVATDTKAALKADQQATPPTAQPAAKSGPGLNIKA